MKKTSITYAAFCLMIVMFASGSHAAEPAFQWGGFPQNVDFLGAPVYNPGREMLGIVTSFVNDSEGKVAFAILWQGDVNINTGRYVAVPFSALSMLGNEPNQIVVLNMDKSGLDSAPNFKTIEDLNNSDLATGIYRYFGQVPYWEKETGK